jgi:hypothetical protein
MPRPLPHSPTNAVATFSHTSTACAATLSSIGWGASFTDSVVVDTTDPDDVVKVDMVSEGNQGWLLSR